jgi:glyoxylase-like metal-dependent hydrolase (beta-lactamase superfamily II)
MTVDTRTVAAEPIDLLHLGTPHVIGSYVVETADGPAIFDCGPTTTIPHLKAGLAERGLDLSDIRHLLLSHIHLDHAGGAGALVRQNPWLQVHVSEVGAPHVIDPARLEASARRLYGPAFDDLWGELVPVPEENVNVAGDDVLGLACFPTPGHAWHHVSYLHGNGTLYAGDAAGVRIPPGRFVMPPCPPPELDLEAWERSLEEIELRAPGRLALVHFGVADDVLEHLAALRETLRTWASRVEDGMDEGTFVAAARYDVTQVDPELADEYDRAAPYWHHFRGLERYWRKRREAAAAAS